MRQAEIMFVEMWRANAVGGYMSADAANEATKSCPGRRNAILGGPADPDCPGLLEHEDDPRGGWRWRLTGRGADLVASYEAALEQGLRILADDRSCDGDHPGPECASPECWHREPTAPAVIDHPCPDCRGSGEIGIPIKYGAMGGISEVWPATCPTCKGSKVAPVFSGVDFGRIPVSVSRPPATGWQQLTRSVGMRLADARSVIEVRRRFGGHTQTIRVRSHEDRGLATSVGPLLAYDGSWWVRVPEDADPRSVRPLPDTSNPRDDEWITDRRAGLRLLAEAYATGRRVEVKGDDDGWIVVGPVTKHEYSSEDYWIVDMIVAGGPDKTRPVRWAEGPRWITDPDAMRDFITNQPEGAAIEARWEGGEQLQIETVKTVARLPSRTDRDHCDLACVVQVGSVGHEVSIATYAFRYDGRPEVFGPVLTAVRPAR